MQTSMQQQQQIVTHFRSLLAALEIPPKVKPKGFVLLREEAQQQIEFLMSVAPTMAILAKLKEVRQLKYYLFIQLFCCLLLCGI